jgi:hypothetical protein
MILLLSLLKVFVYKWMTYVVFPSSEGGMVAQ